MSLVTVFRPYRAMRDFEQLNFKIRPLQDNHYKYANSPPQRCAIWSTPNFNLFSSKNTSSPQRGVILSTPIFKFSLPNQPLATEGRNIVYPTQNYSLLKPTPRPRGAQYCLPYPKLFSSKTNSSPQRGVILLLLIGYHNLS